jgi:hypothetical protein
MKSGAGAVRAFAEHFTRSRRDGGERKNLISVIRQTGIVGAVRPLFDHLATCHA